MSNFNLIAMEYLFIQRPDDREKIMEFLIYRWNIDYFLSSLMEAVRQLIIKLFTK